jgi:hypothetical protein
MLEIPRNDSIVPYNTSTNLTQGLVRSGFNPEKNAQILLTKIENQVNKINFVTSLEERLERVGDDFLNAEAISRLSSHEKALVVNTARRIFNEKEAASLNSRQKEAVNHFFCSLIEKLALKKTGERAEQLGVTTVMPRAKLKAASNSQNSNEDFLREFSNLLGRTLIKYPGYGKFPDVDDSLEELFEKDLISRPIDKDNNNNPLREILIRTLRVADDHFKCEKDHNAQLLPFSAILKLANFSMTDKDSNGQSRYEELGGLCAEANGITLERGFAEALEKLLNTYQIVSPAQQFINTDYPYLNTLALEVAADKIRNPV